MVRKRTQQWLTVLGAAMMMAACAHAPAVVSDPEVARPSSAAGAGGNDTSATSLPLIIRNRSYFDINVYVHRATNSPGRRVGTVSSGGEQRFRINAADLQAGNQLMLGVRAIAGRSAWVSPSLTVSQNVIARLDVMSDSQGDLGRTVLFLENAK